MPQVEVNWRKEIYAQDFPVDDRPHGWIQWKGTDVCMDLNVALIALTPEQIANQEKSGTGFKKEDPTRIDA